MPIGSIEFQERETAPTLPAEGKQKLCLVDGKLRLLTSTGESIPFVKDNDPRLNNTGSDTKALVFAIALG
jgi:hypothetical protein